LLAFAGAVARFPVPASFGGRPFVGGLNSFKSFSGMSQNDPAGVSCLAAFGNSPRLHHARTVECATLNRSATFDEVKSEFAMS